MKLDTPGGRVGISLESLLWFTALTAIGTIVGAYVYQRWILPYMPDANDITAFNSGPVIPGPGAGTTPAIATRSGSTGAPVVPSPASAALDVSDADSWQSYSGMGSTSLGGLGYQRSPRVNPNHSRRHR